MDHHATKTAVALYAGLTLICFIAAIMIFSSILLMVEVSLGGWVTVVSFFGTAAIVCVLGRHGIKAALLGVAIALVAIVICTFVSMAFIDFSFDGNTHHKQAVAFLAEGWNPIIASVESWPRFQELYPEGSIIALWIDHYPRGLWLFGAVFYDLTGSIEAGKSYTLLSMCAAFLIFAGFLRARGFARWQCLLIGLVAAINPITVAQFPTYSNDAFLMMMLFAMIAALFAIADDTLEKHGMIAKTLFIACFIAAVQTKFTGLAYAGIFSVAFLGVYLYLFLKDRRPCTLRRFLFMGCLMLLTLIVAVLVVGYSPYITNWIHMGNPLFPLIGDGAVDIMVNNTPSVLLDKPPIEQELDSLFAAVASPQAQDAYDLQLKVPFSMTISELLNLRVNDARLSGFGPLNSGIALLNLALIFPLLAVSRKRWPVFFAGCVAYYASVIVLMVALGDGWWARYSAYRYLSYLIALIFLFRVWNTGFSFIKARAVQAFAACFIFFVCLNTALFVVVNTGVAAGRSAFQYMQLADMQAQSEDGATFHVAAESQEIGLLFNLDDMGIPYVYEGIVEAMPERTEFQLHRLYGWTA